MHILVRSMKKERDTVPLSSDALWDILHVVFNLEGTSKNLSLNVPHEYPAID